MSRNASRDHIGRAGIALARHGISVPRGQGPLASTGSGRFGRMFGHLPSRDPGEDAIEVLVSRMEGSLPGALILPDTQNTDPLLPAGFTYLGQFIDHDITFDPTSKLQRDNDPDALVNFRTPRFDLDSVYGSGPADQPFLYDWTDGPHPGVKLLVGTDPPRPMKGDAPYAPTDLPRNAQGRALIGDARNDENLLVSQLHLLFIQFHNRVIDHLACDREWPEGYEILEEAQRLVRWHYQWIVVHDFLRRIVSDDVLSDVLRPGTKGEPPSVHRRFFTWQEEPVIPVEFSGAAFRFAHSMVRKSYTLNESDEANDVPLFDPGDKHERWRHLGGFRRRPEALTITWKRFFQIDPTDPPMPGMKINHKLSPPLFSLPPDGAALARLNLRRGRALGLPAGADVAQAMGRDVLDEDELLLTVPEPAKTHLLRATPLWFYLLCEAGSTRFGHGGVHLGPVGGRIVTEVLVGLLEADPSSYLRQAPSWTPCLPREHKHDFTMADLVRFTEGTPPPRPNSARKKNEPV